MKQRGDITIGSIEKKYNINFKASSDKKLEDYLKDEGLSSLSEVLKKLNETGLDDEKQDWLKKGEQEGWIEDGKIIK